MATPHANGILALIDRATHDWRVLYALQRDPAAAIRATGMDVSAEDLANLIGRPETVRAEPLERLRARLAYISWLVGPSPAALGAPASPIASAPVAPCCADRR